MAQLLAYKGLDALTEKDHFPKVFFGSKIDILLVGDSLKAEKKKIAKCEIAKASDHLVRSTRLVECHTFQKHEPQQANDTWTTSDK